MEEAVIKETEVSNYEDIQCIEKAGQREMQMHRE